MNTNGAEIPAARPQSLRSAISDDPLFPTDMRAEYSLAARRNRRVQFQREIQDNGGIDIFKEITNRTTAPITLGPDGKIVQFTRPIDNNTVPMRILKDMRASPIIRAGLVAAKSPIIRAFNVYRIESENDRVKDFVWAALKPILHKAVRTALLSKDFGHAPHEKIFTRRDVTAPNKTVFKNAIVIKKLKELMSDRVDYFVWTKSTEHNAGDFAGFRHNNASDEFVPSEKAWVVTNEKEYGIITGRADTSFAYEPWYWWKVTTMFLNRYLERRGTPFIKGRAPNRVVAKDGTQKAGPELFADQCDALYDGGVAVMPAEFDEVTRQPLWDIDFLEDQGRGEQFIQWIEVCVIYILLALLIPDSVVITPRREGSRALAEIRKEVFDEISTQSVVNIEDHINEFIIPQLIDLNREMLGIPVGAQLPATSIVAQVRPTDRQDLLVDLLGLLVKAKDSPAAQRTFMMLAISDILQELGAPLSSEDMRGIEDVPLTSNDDSDDDSGGDDDDEGVDAT